MIKIVRKPGCVKFIWDKRLIIYLLLAAAIVALVLGLYLFLFMMKPTEGYEEFLSRWGALLLTLAVSIIGDVGIIALFLKMQGAVHVNQTKRTIEVFKGFGLNTRIHSLYFDTLEKIVLTTPFLFMPGIAPSQGLFEQIGIFLKTGEEIKLPFAHIDREKSLEVVKEMAEAAGIPAFDREGNPIHAEVCA